MSLEVIKIHENERWDNIVRSFNTYEVHYLSGYVKAFNLIGEGEPLLFYYDDGKTRAINVMMKRDIAIDKNLKGKIQTNTYFDLITPYGYGGFIIEGESQEAVNEAYNIYCLENNIVCEFIRFNLFSGFEKVYSGEVESRLHNIVRPINMNPEEMLMDFEHKVRKNLKKAKANGLTINIDTEGKNLEKFLEIYYRTMDRNEAKDNFYFNKVFFETLNEMKENIVYFNVFLEDRIISTELVIYNETNCYSYLGGTLSEYFNLRPNEFLKYEIIKWAYQKGIKNFVLGGGYGADDGIFRYKKSFSPKGIVDFYIGKKVFDNEKYTMLNNLSEEGTMVQNNNSFFPIYRR